MTRRRFPTINCSIFFGGTSIRRRLTGNSHDIGLSYQAAIYYGNEEEKKIAEASKESLGETGKFQKPIVTEIFPAAKFYPAEEYHQKYYLKNKADFEAYHVGSGRVAFLEKIWGKEVKP